MTPDAKAQLLAIARASLEAAAAGASPPVFEELPPELQEERAAFVSLHTAGGDVRGCVGTTAAVRPLASVVSEMAQAAALRDPRFAPVQVDEVASLHIEVSVLSIPEAISSLNEVQVGRDGLCVEGRGRRGLLLPQVASERDWPAQRFAEQTCRKAGLDSAAYLEPDVQLFRFDAEVFGE